MSLRKVHGVENLLRGNCPYCGKKDAYYTYTNTGIEKCWACGFDNTAEVMREKKMRVTEFPDRKKLAEKYREKTRKHWRLSEKILRDWKIESVKYTSKNGKTFPVLQLCDFDGVPVKFLSTIGDSPKWVTWPRSKENEKKFFHSRIDPVKIEGDIFIVAGQWDIFALYEKYGIDGISPLNGEGGGSADAVDAIADVVAKRNVIIVFDNDKAGRAGADKLARNLLRYAKPASVKIIDLSEYVPGGGGDLDDYARSGKTKENFLQIVENTPVYVDEISRSLENLDLRDGIATPKIETAYDDKTIKAIWQISGMNRVRRDESIAEISMTLDAEPKLIKENIKKIEKIVEYMHSYAVGEYAKVFCEKNGIVVDKNSSDLHLCNNNVYEEISEEKLYEICQKIYGMATGEQENFNISGKIFDHIVKLVRRNAEPVEFMTDEGKIVFSDVLFDALTLEKSQLSKTDLVKHTLGFPLEGSGDCKNFFQAIDEWFPDETHRRNYLKLCWLAMSKIRDEHLFFILHGGGGDGKGEAAKILESLVGAEATSAVSLDKLSSGGNSSYMAALHEKYLNISDEYPRGEKIDDAVIKRLTGGGLITVDRKYKTAVTFRSKALQVLVTNHYPVVSDFTDGFWRRTRIIKFRKVKSPENGFFQKKILPEMSAVARYVIDTGRKMYYEDGGFPRPSSNNKEIREIKTGNAVWNFWDDMFQRESFIKCYNIESHEGKEIALFDITDYYKRFKSYAEENGYKNMSSEAFRKQSEDICHDLLTANTATQWNREAHQRRTSIGRCIYFYKEGDGPSELPF